MRRSIPLSLCLALVAVQPATSATFDRARIAPELGLDAITRGVTREALGRDVFANPWATVTIGTVDVYDVFPYVENRTFQFVSDPRWNRLVFGEPGRALAGWNGAGTAVGALRAPRGLAADEANRVYVADSGNDRVVVLQAATEHGNVTLAPLYDIRGLSNPYDVAYSDGGTPFTAGDDVLYVADTGRNRVVAFALEASGARRVAELGDLGGGRGRFGGPMAIAAGRDASGNTADVYVADAHSHRIVHLRHEGGALRWIGEASHGDDVLTSLETDQWGNLYAAAPHQGRIRKFNAALAPVAELGGDLERPKTFHVPFFTVRDHRSGGVSRAGRPSGVSVEQWTDATGVSLWSLGVEVKALAVDSEGGARRASFLLTDQADVSVELFDAASGRTLAARPAGTLGAGTHSIALLDELNGAAGDVVLRLTAASSYPDGPVVTAQARLAADGGAAAGTGALALFGNSPNPVTAGTRIAFSLPAGDVARARLLLVDAAGRTVRTFAGGFTPGMNTIAWDGADARGRRVAAGVYFYRLEAGERSFTRKLVMVR